jgi:hypothetical protein
MYIVSTLAIGGKNAEEQQEQQERSKRQFV